MDRVSVVRRTAQCSTRSGVTQGVTSPATGTHAHALCTWATSTSATITLIVLLRDLPRPPYQNEGFVELTLPLN